MNIKFKLIVKRSSLNKLDELIRKGTVKAFVINNDEYCLMQDNIKDPSDDQFNTSIYIWPRCWGYDGRRDGHCMWMNPTNSKIFLNYSEYLIDVLLKLNKESLAKDAIIEIDEYQ